MKKTPTIAFAIETTHSKVTIRSAAASDEKQIKQLLKTTSGVWQAWWRETAVAKAIRSAGKSALVASRGDKVIGFACFHDVGFRAYLSEMVVAESEQGNGIGSKLLKRGEAMLAAGRCRLVIGDAYPPAEGFYSKHGWGKPKAVLMSKVIRQTSKK